MAIYSILLALSVFMIALVLLIIQQTFFHWKRENQEAIVTTYVNRPAVGMMLSAEHCILRRKFFAESDITVYDLMSRSTESLCTVDNVPEYITETTIAKNIITEE